MKLSGPAAARLPAALSLWSDLDRRLQGSANGFGNLDHGGGYATSYAHLNSLSVSAGQTVTHGQKTGAAVGTCVERGGKAGSSLYNSPSEHCGS